MHSVQKNRALLLKVLKEYIDSGMYAPYTAILEELRNDDECSLRTAINRLFLHFSPDYKQRYYHICSCLYHRKITELNNDKFKNKHKEESHEHI